MIPTGIRDSSYRPQANVAQGTKGSHSVLFEDNDWRGEAFYIPIIIDESIFEGLDDILTQVNPPATILGETAIAVAAPAAIEATTGEDAMEEAVAEANAMFNQMGIAASYVQVFEDESEMLHAAAMEQPEVTQEEEELEELEENALYARDLPTPNMASWVIQDVRTDTTFTEFWEIYLLHMEDTRTEVTIQMIE